MQHNISTQEFKKAFCEGWLKIFPTPKQLRYDEEGFLRNLDLIHWLEGQGIQLDPIAGESGWQLGKHSRHLQVLKENVNLLTHELGHHTPACELFALAVSAKNATHQIRGYSPNQWALGSNHQRIGSFLENGDHLPWNSHWDDVDFAEVVKRETAAKRLFLEADSRRRIYRALRAQGRPLRVFETGTLVYYYRRSRKEVTKYGGRWFGPARVLCHEKTGDSTLGNHPGSIVWISHAGVLLRCSPEQLRVVTRDVSNIDREINGPADFHTMLKDVGSQRKYFDLAKELDGHTVDHESLDENIPRHRVQGKRKFQPDATPASDLTPDGDPRGDDQGPQEQPREAFRDREAQADRTSPHHADGGSPPDEDRLRKVQRSHLPGGSPGQVLRPVGGKSRESRHELRGDEVLPDLPLPEDHLRSSSSGGRLQGRGIKRNASAQEIRDEEAAPRRGEPPSGRLRSGERGVVRSDVQGQRDSPAAGNPGSSPDSAQQHRADSGTDLSQVDEPLNSPMEHGRSGRSRSPAGARFGIRRHGDTKSSGNALTTIAEESEGQQKASETFFASVVGQREVCEIHVAVAARDVHCKRGVWMLNQRVKKSAEVNIRKLNESDQQEFEQAMKKELDSFMSNDAVRVCEAAGIPRERVLGMRWIYTWKQVEDPEGKPIGRKAKARLILKGFQDPDLLTVDRQAPTMSTLGRNAILSLAAKKRFKVFLGDIKTAYLNGDATELERRIYAEPPADVRQKLDMRPHEILRVAKAVYGLLHAPKKWFEKLRSVLLEHGWVAHQLDQRVFKLVDPQNQVVCGYLGVHVDDVVCTGHGVYFDDCVQKLLKSFPFGSWKCAQAETVKFCGCDLKQLANCDVVVTQERFALGIDEIPLDSLRKGQKQDDASPQEKQNMRRILGALNWRAVQSAPWLLATVSHLQGCVETATVSDLLEVNKLVRWQRRYATHGLTFVHNPQDTMVVTFTDASWATRRDGSSQGGQITLLMSKSVMHGETSHFSVLCWGSRRLRRVARSSTSAEVQMSGNALDQHEFCKLFMIIMEEPNKIDLRQPDNVLRSQESCLISDSKNVYDGLEKVETSGLQMEERRTAIELLGIKERLAQANIRCRWVSGDQELADGLTKPWQGEQLVKALQKTRWSIIFDPEFISAKRKKQLGKLKHLECGDLNLWLRSVFLLDEFCRGQKDFWGCDVSSLT